MKEQAAEKYVNSLYWPEPKEGQSESDIEVKLTLVQAKGLAYNSFMSGWDAVIQSMDNQKPIIHE